MQNRRAKTQSHYGSELMLLIALLCYFLIIVSAIIVLINIAVLLDIELSALHGLYHLSLTTTWYGNYFYDSHFIAKKTEAQRA